MHVHSVYSHDACDGEPQLNGKINEKCLADLREAICRNHIDIVFLTEHLDHLTATRDLSAVLNIQQDDVAIRHQGRIVGSRQRCRDGHEAHVYLGAENYVSSIGLVAHPHADAPALKRFYSAYNRKEIDDLRRDGALIVVPHAERGNVSLQRMQEMQPDLIEAYNLHANLSAKRRGALKVVERGLAASQFLLNPYLEPDLIFLALLDEDEIALTKWSQAAAEMRLAGVLAVDAHQNLPAIKMIDGERVDSYRRTMRWFSNFVEVDGRFDRDAVLAALKGGKVFMVFEAFGTPNGLEFHALEGDKAHAMGETVSADRSGDVSLVLKCPQVAGLPASTPQPQRDLLILRATGAGWKEVARSRDADLHYVIKEPGTYRGEVRIRPTHLARYLAGARTLIRDVPWIYANPIYVR